MSPGEKTIEWLYHEQLRVDDPWAHKREQGFRWWADQNAQDIEVIKQLETEHGEQGSFLRVKTELLRDFDPTDDQLKQLNEFLMPFPSMAGPVYDAENGTLSLCSLVCVHEDIREWMQNLISVAATLQIGEARIMGPRLSEIFECTFATSAHPESGVRTEPDDMADLIAMLYAPMGQRPCAWPHEEFEEAVHQYMQQPPSLGASNGGLGLTVEFPFGHRSSLCQFQGSEEHPRLGNGLLIRQRFPAQVDSESEGITLALELNDVELNQTPVGYGFGSYCWQGGLLLFTSFIPNAAYRPGLLPSLYYGCAGRAHLLDNYFTQHDES